MKGFTLLEVVIALSILGFLVYIGSGPVLGMVPKYRLESAVWEIRSAMNAARHQALFEGRSTRVRFDTQGLSLDVYDSAAEVWRFRERRTLDGVRISANNAPIFTAQGTVTGLVTITVVNRWGGYRLTLAITGRLKSARIT